MLKRKQMEDIINRDGSVAFKGKSYSRVEDLPSSEEVEEYYAAPEKQIDYPALFSKWVTAGSIKVPTPKVPVTFVPPTDSSFSDKFPRLDNAGLGRIPQMVDNRDLLHPMSEAVKPVLKELKEITYRYWTTAKALDQGDTAECVSYSRTQLLLSGPVKNTSFIPIYDFYKLCQRLDEWEGENYDGTSVRAMCKAMLQEGHISGYTWAEDIETAVKHVLGIGPIVFGTNWSNSMFYPDAITGFIRYMPETGIAGGHAYCVVGANRNKLCPDGSKGAFRLINSWGTSWGDKGKAFLSFTDAAKLMWDWGECAGVNELKFNSQALG